MRLAAIAHGLRHQSRLVKHFVAIERSLLVERLAERRCNAGRAAFPASRPGQEGRPNLLSDHAWCAAAPVLPRKEIVDIVPRSVALATSQCEVADRDDMPLSRARA